MVNDENKEIKYVNQKNVSQTGRVVCFRHGIFAY